MLPLFRLLDAQLDVLSPGGYDDETYLSHDVSDVWVLGRHQRADEDRAAADLDRGAISIDEYREVCDREPLNVPGTRVLWIPAARLAIDDGQPAHDGDAHAAGNAPIGNGQLGMAPAGGAGAGVPNTLPAGFGVDPSADLEGPGQDGGAPAAGVTAGPPNQRAIGQADRTAPGSAVDAAPVQVKSREGEQSGGRPARR